MQSRMNEENTTLCNLDPRHPPKPDCSRFDAMTEAECHAAALADPDCPLATDAQQETAGRIPRTVEIRRTLLLMQAEFAYAFGLSLGAGGDWEQGGIRRLTQSVPSSKCCFVKCSLDYRFQGIFLTCKGTGHAMKHDSIQIRTAVRMLIDFLLEHREQLEQEMNAKQREDAKPHIVEQPCKLLKGKFTSKSDAMLD